MAALNAELPRRDVAPAFPLAYPVPPPMHEFVASAAPLKKTTGIKATDVAKRLIDLGYHPRPCTSRSSSTKR